MPRYTVIDLLEDAAQFYNKPQDEVDEYWKTHDGTSFLDELLAQKIIVALEHNDRDNHIWYFLVLNKNTSSGNKRSLEILWPHLTQ